MARKSDAFKDISENASTFERKKKGREKLTIELTEDEKICFDTFCAADALLKVAEGRHKNAKNTILPVLRRKYLLKCLEQKRKVENPAIVTDKAWANFIVRNVFKINVKEDMTVKEALVAAGLSENDAEEVCNNEIVEVDEVNFRPLNELKNGEPIEQKVLEKLANLVRNNFTSEEQGILLRKERKIKVEDDFLDRTYHYAKTFNKLDALLSIISPQWLMSNISHCDKDPRLLVESLGRSEE